MSIGFVLIPGGGLSDWQWKKLIPLLSVDAVTVPRRIEVNNCETRRNAQISDVLNYANRIIEESGFGDVVLVGHSGGAMFAGLLGKTNPRVRHVVFIAGNIPADGMTLPDALPEELRTNYIAAANVQTAYDLIPMKVIEQTIRENFCNTCKEDDIDAVLNEMFQPEPLCILEARADWSNYPDIGKTYVVCTQDGTLPACVQEAMAAHLGITDIERISSDHMVMISHPEELANVLNSIVMRYQ